MMTPEAKVRKQVITYLRKRGHWVLPHRTEAGINPRTGDRLAFNENYATRGEADLLVFSKSSPISPLWLELKRKGKRKIDPAQMVFKTIAEEMGHEYAVVNCVQDLVDLGL